MSLTSFFEKIVRKQKTICKVYDTSAIRNYFGIFKEIVETKNDWLIVVPEGVLHEINVAKSVDKLCRIIYNYITTYSKEKSNLRVEVTEDNIRNWSVDEQVIHVVEKYQKKSCDAELVSCDKEQCFRAELKGIKCSLLPVVSKEFTAQKFKNNFSSIKGTTKFDEKKAQEISPSKISVPIIIINGDKYLNVNRYLAVYDKKGRRKIGKEGYLKFDPTDKFLCNDREYIISKLESNKVIFVPEN